MHLLLQAEQLCTPGDLVALSEMWAQLSGLSSQSDGQVEWMPWGM